MSSYWDGDPIRVSLRRATGLCAPAGVRVPLLPQPRRHHAAQAERSVFGVRLPRVPAGPQGLPLLRLGFSARHRVAARGLRRDRLPVPCAAVSVVRTSSRPCDRQHCLRAGRGHLASAAQAAPVAPRTTCSDCRRCSRNHLVRPLRHHRHLCRCLQWTLPPAPPVPLRPRQSPLHSAHPYRPATPTTW